MKNPPQPALNGDPRIPAWQNPSQSSAFQDFWRILIKYRYLILASVLIVLIVNGVRVFSQKSIYHAEASLELKPERLAFGEEALKQNFSYTTLAFINTQMKVARSREVAEVVVKRTGRDRVMRWLGRTTTPGKRPPTEMELASSLLWHVQTYMPEETFIIMIAGEATTPESASEIANTWAETLIDFNRESEIKSSRTTGEALTKQIDRLQKSLGDKEAKLAQMAGNAQIQVLDQQLNFTAQKVERLNQEVQEAQNELLDKQTKLRQIEGSAPEGLPEIQGNAAVQSLKQACNAAEQEYVEKSKIFKPGYPGMDQIIVKRDQVCGQYHREVSSMYSRVLQQAHADLNATAAKQGTLRAQFKTTGPEIKEIKTTEYQNLKVEVDNEKKLLDQLNQQKQSAQLTTESGGIQMNSLMRIVDLASPPKASVRPLRAQSMGMAFLVGLFGGVALAFLFNFMDTKVHSHEDIEKHTSLRFLTFIPEMEKEVDEQMNRNAFRFLNKFVSALKPKEGKPRIILVTSPEPSEGKSFVASNFAITEALEGKRAILFDMDLHRPTIHRAFNVSRKPGLSDLLVQSGTPNFDRFPRLHKHLTIVPGGIGVTQQLVTSLESSRLDEILNTAAEQFDIVIVDTGPMLVTPETSSIAQRADGIILVVRSNQTPIRILKMSEEVLRKMKIRVLGVVLNRVSLTDKGSYYHYHNPYRHYYSYYNFPVAKEK